MNDRGELLGTCWNCGAEIHDRSEDASDWLESGLCGACDDTPARDEEEES